MRVPFRSGNEMVNAVVAGTTPIAFLGLSNMLPQIRGGQITGLALNANARSPLFPDIPTLKEATGEDYPPPWFGLFAPAGTPKPIIEKIHAEVGASPPIRPGGRRTSSSARSIPRSARARSSSSSSPKTA